MTEEISSDIDDKLNYYRKNVNKLSKEELKKAVLKLIDDNENMKITFQKYKDLMKKIEQLNCEMSKEIEYVKGTEEKVNTEEDVKEPLSYSLAHISAANFPSNLPKILENTSGYSLRFS